MTNVYEPIELFSRYSLYTIHCMYLIRKKLSVSVGFRVDLIIKTSVNT